jgi:hypothetical protein
MSVLVEGAAESITSMDVEAVDSVRFGDRFGGGLQGCRAVQGAVRPVLVVERLELAEGVEQMGLVPDQGTVEEFVSAGLHPTFHDRVHAGNADAGGDDLDALGLEDGVERAGDLLSRSLIRYRTVAPAS